MLPLRRSLGRSAPRAARGRRPAVPTAQRSLRRKLTCDATSSPSDSSLETSTSGRYQNNNDPFVKAAYRIRSLLETTGDGEDELMLQMAEEEAPEKKLAMCFAIGGVSTVASLVLIYLVGRDPTGGIGLDEATLTAVGTGALASLPLWAAKTWSYSPATYREFPVLQDMHEAVGKLVSPWFRNMSREQVFLMMMCDVLPLTVLLLPATQGVIEAAGVMFNQIMDPSTIPTNMDPLGVGLMMDSNEDAAGRVASAGPIPFSKSNPFDHMGPLLFTGLVAGVSKNLELGVEPEEFETVQEAIDNANRFYRVTGMGVNSKVADATGAAQAFKAVAQVYLETRVELALAAGFIVSLEVVYLGMIWYLAGNLAAPFTCTLITSWVDWSNQWNAAQRPGGRRKPRVGGATKAK